MIPMKDTILASALVAAVITLGSVVYWAPSETASHPHEECRYSTPDGYIAAKPGEYSNSGRGFPLQFIEIESCNINDRHDYTINPLLMLINIGLYTPAIVGIYCVFDLLHPQNKSRKK